MLFFIRIAAISIDKLKRNFQLAFLEAVSLRVFRCSLAVLGECMIAYDICVYRFILGSSEDKLFMITNEEAENKKQQQKTEREKKERKSSSSILSIFLCRSFSEYQFSFVFYVIILFTFPIDPQIARRWIRQSRPAL